MASEAGPVETLDSTPRKMPGWLVGAIFLAPYLFAWVTLRKGYSTEQRVLSIGWASFFICFYGAAGLGLIDLKPAPSTAQLPPESSRGAVAQDTPATPPPRIYANATCAELSDTFSARSKLTGIQKDAMWRSNYAGKWVKWTAKVNLVEKGAFGGLNVQFKCSEESLILDGHASFERDQERALMRFSKDDSISFEGKLSEHGEFLGIGVTDAIVR